MYVNEKTTQRYHFLINKTRTLVITYNKKVYHKMCDSPSFIGYLYYLNLIWNKFKYSFLKR